MCPGREFQVWAAATGKARLPTVASLTGGTTRRLVPAQRRALRPGTSTVEVSGPRYRGALPWRTLNVAGLWRDLSVTWKSRAEGRLADGQ